MHLGGYGSFLLTTNKLKIIKRIEKLIGVEKLKAAKLQLCQYLNGLSGRSSIVLFDVMHVVNSITKKSIPIRTVLDFANIFKNRICSASANFGQVVVAFEIKQLNTYIKIKLKNPDYKFHGLLKKLERRQI